MSRSASEGGEGVARRQLLTAAATLGGIALLGSPAKAGRNLHGPHVSVSPEGDGDYGPRTPGTRTGGVQEAIDAVHARGGGVVTLRAGVHLVNQSSPPPPAAKAFDCGQYSLLLYDNITLRGEGAGATIVRVAAPCNTNFLLGWRTSNVCIEDLTFDGAGLNAGYGVAVFGVDHGKGTAFHDVRLRGLVCTDFGGSAIGIAGGQNVLLEECEGRNSKIGFELGSPSVDYTVLHCRVTGCHNGTLIFDQADQYNEAGNIRPRIIGGCFDGEGKSSGIALWDCWEAMVVGVQVRRGITCGIQIGPSGRKSITTPVGGGIIEACVAEETIASRAGCNGIGALQDGVRVAACSLIGNAEVGLRVAPGEGGRVVVSDCLFRPGAAGIQRRAIQVDGQNVTLVASGNLHEGAPGLFLANPEALSAASLVAGNPGFNPVGILAEPPLPASGESSRNSHPFPVRVWITGGRVRAVALIDSRGNRAVVGSSGGASLILQPGESLAIDYARKPVWTWAGM